MKFYGRLSKDDWELISFCLSVDEKDFAERYKKKKISENRKIYGNNYSVDNSAKNWKDSKEWVYLYNNNESDYFYRKRFFSKDFEKKEWEEFKEDNWKHCRYSDYDCTGDTFTISIEKYKIPDGIVVYELFGIDI